MSKVAFIYKITCKDENVTDCYVGSTKDIHKRRIHHATSCNNPNDRAYNYPVYKSIRDNEGWNNWIMKKVKTVHYNEKDELLERERYWIHKLNANLNKQIPTRTAREWYDDNRDVNLVKARKYRENNREHVKECMKQYRELNKEVICAKKKKYYQNNKDEILAKQREKFDCPCGCKYSYSNKARHERTKKHQNYLSSQSSSNKSDSNSDSL